MSLNRLRALLRRPRPPPSSLQIGFSSDALPGAMTRDSSYLALVEATGGSGRYRFSIHAGSMPPGFYSDTFSAHEVVLFGAPLNAGVYSGIVIRVTDSLGATADLALPTMTVTAPAPDYVATNRATLLSHLAAAAASGVRKIIHVADGGTAEYGTTIISAINIVASAEIVLRGATDKGATLPGIDFDGCKNITLRQVKAKRLRSVTGSNADPTSGVIRALGTENIWIDDCEISADPLATFSFAYPANLNLLAGITGGSSLSPSPGLKVTNNNIHDVRWPVGAVGAGMHIRRNRYRDCAQNFGNYAGASSGLLHKDNRGIGIWFISTDGVLPPDPGPHSSVLGLSFDDDCVSSVRFEGDILISGNNRQDDGDGQIGYATGGKINDMGHNVTASFAGDVMTVTAVSGWLVQVGQKVIRTGLASPTYVVARLSGTGGTGTYQVSTSQTLAAGSTQLQAVFKGSFRSCMWLCNGSIGMELNFSEDTDVDFMTVVCPPDIDRGETPSLYVANLGPGVRPRKVIFNGYTYGSEASGNYGIHPSLYDGADGFIVAQKTATSGPSSYAGLFEGGEGGSFENVTLENALDVFKPKAGSRAEGHGATACYDHATGISWYEFEEKAATTIPSGVAMDEVLFNGTNTYLRATKGAAAQILDLANGAEFFFQAYVHFVDDNDRTPLQWSNVDFQIRRLGTGYLRISGKDTSGGTWSLDTSLKVTAADGPTLITGSIKFATYDYWIAKGAVIDAFARPSAGTTWSGLAHRRTASNCTFGANSNTTASGFTPIGLLALKMHDAWVEPTTENLSKIVAQDGRPVDDSDMTELFGAPVRSYIAGDATAVNAALGLQLGSSAQKFIRSGSGVVDA